MSLNVAPAAAEPRTLPVLGTPLLLTSHADCLARCLAWSQGTQPVAVEFANTQVVTMRRGEPEFRALTTGFDTFVPDATPLIWCLNACGAGLGDRVYGPAFMRHCLVHSPASLTHYLIGGSERCGTELRRIFQAQNPNLRIVGSFHGVCEADGVFREGGEELLIELGRLSPDFIWVGLGTPKQQGWIHRNKARVRRGVLLSIGQAFDVNAGLRPDAPKWMQRVGLTWLYRLCSEPRRLLPRYVKYNSLFLFYLLWDGLRGRAFHKEFSVQATDE